MNINADKIIKEHLKNMTIPELEMLAEDIRGALVHNISNTGGHLASNLGVVELTIAIEKSFDTPKDKVVWDVGHQTYVHKMLTGRWNAMHTLRQLGGMSGFPKRAESEHDMFDAGHSGTSISVALGYAKARELMCGQYSCVAVIGDGALTGGVAYEALNSAGAEKIPLIVILNDNEMSISKNVGGIARHLQHLRASTPYLDFKKNIKNILSSKPKLEKKLERIRDSIKYAIVPAAIFEELGFKYFGPIDGHDIKALLSAIQMAKTLHSPVLLHVVTKKGKGYLPAEKHPDKYHGTKPFNPETGCCLVDGKECSYTEIFGEALLRLATKDERIVAVTAAMTEGTGLLEMKEKFSERVFDAGIAEQHAVSFAAGLALNGMRPVVSIYSTFLQRAYDQVLMEVCLQNLPVIFVLDRAGNSGNDGETHHGQFDLAYLSAMPNMTILAPKDGIELTEMLEHAFSLASPCAIRYPKGMAPDLSAYGRTRMDGRPEMIISGGKNAIISIGAMTQVALDAAEILRDKAIHTSVLNMRTVKPFDASELRDRLKPYTSILTLEDGAISGGIGMHISATLAQCKNGPTVVNLGWPDEFIPHGTIKELHEKYGLDSLSVAKEAEKFFEKTT